MKAKAFLCHRCGTIEATVTIEKDELVMIDFSSEALCNNCKAWDEPSAKSDTQEARKLFEKPLPPPPDTIICTSCGQWLTIPEKEKK